MTLRLAALGQGGRQPLPLARGRRYFRRLAAAFAVFLAGVGGGSTTVFACPVCFGAEETTMVSGTRLGVMVMLGITVVMQGAFVGFFLYLRQRAKRHADTELDSEWSELQRASKTS